MTIRPRDVISRTLPYVHCYCPTKYSCVLLISGKNKNKNTRHDSTRRGWLGYYQLPAVSGAAAHSRTVTVRPTAAFLGTWVGNIPRFAFHFFPLVFNTPPLGHNARRIMLNVIIIVIILCTLYNTPDDGARTYARVKPRKITLFIIHLYYIYICNIIIVNSVLILLSERENNIPVTV